MRRLNRCQRYTIKQSDWLLLAVLLCAHWLMVSSALRKSATVDEPAHIHRGVAYLLEGATHFLLGNPVVGDAIAVLPVLLEPDLQLPTEHPAWAAGDWSVAGNVFMWEGGNQPHRILFLARLVGIWFALWLGALVYRWGKDVAGPAAGLVAAVLLLLEPNIIAHARLVTNDVSVAFCFTLSVYGFWLWARRRGASVWPLVVAGIGLGLGGVLKYTSLTAVPVLGLLALWLAIRWRSWRPFLAIVVIGIVGGLVIWVSFGLAIRPFPGGAFWDDLLWQLQYVGDQHGVYLNGQISTSGWWHYFAVAFLIKTPLPTLILLIWALLKVVIKRPAPGVNNHLFLFLPPLLYFLQTQTTAINIGYRYLLSTTPFVALFIGTMLAPYLEIGDWRLKTINLQSLISNLQPKLFGLLLITFCLHTFFIWPNYISYFNWLVGGQQHGWRILSDSNVDWGQDLVALANWQHKTGLPLKLSYFGTAYPSAYGLQFESLPTWEPGPEQTAPQRQAFYPSDPAPGFYAISVTNLHGVVLGERPQTFAYFREKEPIFKAGNSIFVYEVKPTGDPVQVALSGITPASLPAAFHDQFGSNDVNVRWFNESTGSIYAPGGMWQVTQEGSAVDVHGFPFSIQSTDLFVWEGWQLRWLSPAEPGNHAVLANFGLAELVDLQSLTVEEGRIQLRTIWRVQQSTPRPLKIFVHALDAQAEIVGQSDVLDVDSRSWAAGDWVSQTHDFTLSATPVSLRIGLYDSRTGERLAAPFAAPYPLAPIP